LEAVRLKAAERIYSLYPRKIARKKAIKAICAALAEVEARGEPDPESYLSVRTSSYAASRKAILAKDPDSENFTPHPASWFNAGRYDDEPQTAPDHSVAENGFVWRAPTPEEVALIREAK